MKAFAAKAGGSPRRPACCQEYPPVRITADRRAQKDTELDAVEQSLANRRLSAWLAKMRVLGPGRRATTERLTNQVVPGPSF